MRDKTIVVTTLLIAVMMLSILTIGTRAFVYSNGTSDSNFELFGPRIDKILVKMYGTLDAEIAALQAGEIDITDWPLTKPMIDTLTLDPNVAVLGYGGEAGYYTFNFNNNPHPNLGNPEDALYPSPVYPNPTSVVAFRQALSHFIDNVALVTGPGQGLFDAIYTPIPAYMSFWIHPDIRPGGSLAALTYPFDPTYATSAGILDANGFPLSAGVRYWDRNLNGVKDAGEDFSLKVYTRADALRRGAGDQMQAGLIATGIPYVRQEITGGQAGQIVMTDKDYHMYTSGWIFIGPDPDYMYDLYHADNYWHPSNPPNFGYVSVDDAPMQAALKEGLKYAVDIPTALTNALDFQELFAGVAAEKPLASTSAPKAYHKAYVGAEAAYTGDLWTHIVNQKGQGENSWWSTLNMYPEGHPFSADGTMTVRYGWEQTSMPLIVNPIYSSWYWESEIYGRVYDGMGARNPYTLGPVEVPQLAENWSLGTWVDPNDGLTKSSVTVTLRPDIMWNDGVPLTIDDVIYTFLQCPPELAAKGASPPWWQPTVDQMAGFYKLDQYSATILMKVNTFLAQSWVVGNIVIPKHIWQPFIAASDAAVIMGDLGVNQVGTGPFLYTGLVPASTVTLDRNPTYYLASPVDPVKEDPYGVLFNAQAPSVQISPTKITDSGAGTGNVKITAKLQNHGKTAGATVTYSVTLTKLLGPGTTVSLASGTGQAIAAGGVFTAYDATRTVAKGKWSIDVVLDVTYQGSTFHHEYHKIVFVTVQGDINGDGIVDIIDIVIVAGHFGSIIGTPGYDPLSDVNHDGVVDILDIVKVAGVYGYTYL